MDISLSLRLLIGMTRKFICFILHVIIDSLNVNVTVHWDSFIIIFVFLCLRVYSWLHFSEKCRIKSHILNFSHISTNTLVTYRYVKNYVHAIGNIMFYPSLGFPVAIPHTEDYKAQRSL